MSEKTTTEDVVEAYRRRFGNYPEVVLADQLYGSRDNRKYLKKMEFAMEAKPLDVLRNAQKRMLSGLSNSKDSGPWTVVNGFPLRGNLDKVKTVIVSTISEPSFKKHLKHG